MLCSKATYLQSRDVHLPEVIGAIKPLRVEIAGLAARNSRSSPRAELVEFVEREEKDLQSNGEMTYRQFLASEREFGRLLTLQGGNVVLNLFLSIVYDLVPFTRRDEDVYVNHPERMDAYRRQRVVMARAIMNGDEEMARLSSLRCSNLIIDWVNADAMSLRQLDRQE